MKTAISIPDPLFQAAEAFAHEQGVSRSELYARAIQHYLEQHRYHGITDALNQVYATEASQLDSAIIAAQARILPKDEW
jgi:metal-responsive CopG/Arc/MetJ family transcriptional regulator